MISSAISADLGRQEMVKGSSEALATVTGIVDGTGSIGAAVGQVRKRDQSREIAKCTSAISAREGPKPQKGQLTSRLYAKFASCKLYIQLQ